MVKEVQINSSARLLCISDSLASKLSPRFYAMHVEALVFPAGSVRNGRPQFLL